MADAVSERSLYALALLYLACSQSTDGELAQTEVDAVTERIQEWSPTTPPAQVGKILSKALEVYNSTLSEADRLARIIACAGLVRRDVGEDLLPKVMADLRAIIEADGLVSEGEDEFMFAVEKAFGLAD
jgi:hypothetical protein